MRVRHEAEPAARLQLVRSLNADGLVTDLEGVLRPNGALTAFGRQLEAFCTERRLAVGAVLYPSRKPGVFTEPQCEVLWQMPFVWSVSTDSMIRVAPFTRGPGAKAVDGGAAGRFSGKEVDLQQFALGYAKANRFCDVYQDEGVHVKIAEYEPGPEEADAGLLEGRVSRLEDRMMYAEKNWPFYSGGGVGTLRGVRGDFAAEVDYTVDTVAQATTLKMAGPDRHAAALGSDAACATSRP